MTGWRGRLGALAAAAAGVLLFTSIATGTAHAERLAAAVPSEATPNIENGAAYAIAKVGGKIVVGGTFTAATNRGSDTPVTRNRLLAFDASTGKLDTGFAPSVSGTSVAALLPGPNDHTVYVGGTFTSIGGVTRRNLALVDTDTGDVVAGFKGPAFNGAVGALRKGGGRLLVGGTFTAAGTAARKGLASLDLSTGVTDSYLDVALDGHHNWTGEEGQAKGAVGASAMDVSPDGGKLVVLGNFTTADGLARDQIVRISLGGTSAAVDQTWSTTAYEDTCNDGFFDSYVRDVDYAPDGSYFAVVTSGGYGGPTSACDATSRFEGGATGSVQPTWVDFTGADTLYSVAATNDVVYAGGHQRWMNNHDGRDTPGPGAVPRPGIAAHDARTGVPVSWNPGRHPRGVGTRVMLATDAGLYIGSDTNYIGNRKYLRGKVAYFPFDGTELPEEGPGTLPGTLVLARPGDGIAIKRSFTGATVGSDQVVAGTATWSSVRGIFQVDGTLFYGYTDDTLRKRTFDGTTFGPVSNVDPYDDPAWASVETGSGQTYRGTKPSFYAQLSDMNGMVYRDGRLYYTLSSKKGLYWRAFAPDSGVVSNVEHLSSTMARWDVSGGMFLVGDTLYFGARSSGNLYRTAWSDGKPEGTLTTTSGPNVDGKDWRTRALFLLTP